MAIEVPESASDARALALPSVYRDRSDARIAANANAEANEATPTVAPRSARVAPEVRQIGTTRYVNGSARTEKARDATDNGHASLSPPLTMAIRGSRV